MRRFAIPLARQAPTVAALLSFLWPGLGQLYLGRRRAAALFAAPAIVVALLLLWQARDGVQVLLARLLLVPTTAAILVLVTIFLAVWRIASIAAAGYQADRPGRIAGKARRSPGWAAGWRGTGALVVLLSALVVASHGLVIWVGVAFIDAGNHIYVTGGPQPQQEPGASFPADVGSLPTPYASPDPFGRINILLIGADSGMGYNHSLTDSMIVVSVDPTKKVVDMLSFPRDIAQFPLYSGGTFSGKLNSLVTYAAAHPSTMPDGGIQTLEREIGYLLGVPIHYYAFVNLAGFKNVVDAVGGVDVVNPRDIADAGYQFPDGKVGFFLSAGLHHLDGRLALAYVRTRNGPGDNDFTRARRQQQVLVALRDRLTDPALLPKLSTILQALSRAVQTDYPAGDVPALFQLADQIPQANVTHYVLGPPYARQPAKNVGTYELIIDRARFAALSVRLFGAASAYATEPQRSPAPSPQ